MTEDEIPNTPDDYNRKHAWNDEQDRHSNDEEWHNETLKITKGAYAQN